MSSAAAKLPIDAAAQMASTFQDRFLSRLEALSARVPFEFPAGSLPAGYRPAAVLLPFWPRPDGGVDVVLTERPAHMSSHPGQVSFPGGRRDADDETFTATALREAREELGIDPDAVRVMGRLDDAWSVAGHYIVPVVGWLERRPELVPLASEVAEILIVDVETLLRPESSYEHVVAGSNPLRRTHAFRWEGGNYVWGLTADILLELLLWVQEKPSSRGALRQRHMQGWVRRA
jgi:8-oxo-dGTP pyrophosphatase MutT (NUDIX family)